jgi:hypothetical protein
MSQGLPNTPIHDLAYQECSPDHLYVGTDQGVFFWNAALGTWVCWNDNLPLAIVWDLEFNKASGTLLAATHGRGLWEADVVPSPTACPLACTPPPGLMAMWLPFDEGVGTTATNAVGGNAAQHVNGPSVTIGKVGNARTYSGSASNHSVVASYPELEIGLADLTVEGWVNVPTTATIGLRSIIDKRTASGSNTTGYHVWLDSLHFGIQLGDGNGGGVNYYSNAFMPADGVWHQFAVTVDRDSATGVQFYIDGTLVGLALNPTGQQGSLANNGRMVVGAWTGGDGAFFEGGIDELEIFATALSASDIRRLYDAQSAGKCREFGIAPPTSVLCLGPDSLSTTAFICNAGVAARTFYYWFQPMAGGVGCSVPGPTMFTPSTPTAITVAANSWAPVPVTIQMPPSLIFGGSGCYTMLIWDSITNELSSTRGIVTRDPTCATFVGGGGGDNGLFVGRAVELGPVQIFNGTGALLNAAYRIRAQSARSIGSAQVIRLNDLAPGEAVTGVLALAPGGSTHLALTAEFALPDPLNVWEVILEIDPDGSGQYRTIGATQIRNVIPATVCRADWNSDGMVNSQDFFDFLNAFFKADAAADFNNDSIINSQDFFDFLNALFVGCP